ncbi:MAG: DUF2281 domain-containing protein [bacterium]|nr:DUF2281 domain-containing protein [bacterium]
MTVAERILQQVTRLPEPLQAEVLDFVEYLQSKVGPVRASGEEEAWQAMSLSQATRGMESEPSPYSAEDLKGHVERAAPIFSRQTSGNADSAERE